MFKFIKKSSFILIFLLGSFTVSAGIINYSIVKHDKYITIKHNDGSSWLDWAWASSVNVQYYDGDGRFTYDGDDKLILNSEGKPLDKDNNIISESLYNELYAPDHIEGWRKAKPPEFEFFQQYIELDDFKTDEKDYIEATSWWNSLYKKASDNDPDVYVDDDAFSGNMTNSWVKGSSYNFADDDIGTSDYDIFYVRTHVPTSVPEPSTLMIFALGLIALASKKKVLTKSTK